MLTIHKTRYKELGYTKITQNLWRFVDLETTAVIGDHYRSKAELLADLSAYALAYGCVEANWEVKSLADIYRKQLLHALGHIANTRGSVEAYDVAKECAALMHSPSTIINEGQQETGRAIYVAAIEYWDSLSDDPIGKPG